MTVFDEAQLISYRLVLFSYHRRLRMISEVLELRVKSGQVSHSLCMCLVSHSYGGLGVERDVGGGWYACGTKPGVGRMLRDAGALLECKVIH